MQTLTELSKRVQRPNWRTNPAQTCKVDTNNSTVSRYVVKVKFATTVVIYPWTLPDIDGRAYQRTWTKRSASCQTLETRTRVPIFGDPESTSTTGWGKESIGPLGSLLVSRSSRRLQRVARSVKSKLRLDKCCGLPLFVLSVYIR